MSLLLCGFAFGVMFMIGVNYWLDWREDREEDTP